MIDPLTRTPIVSQAQADALLASERALNAVLPVIEKADAAGIDVAQYREVHAALIERINAFKTHFLETPKLKRD